MQQLASGLAGGVVVLALAATGLLLSTSDKPEAATPPAATPAIVEPPPSATTLVSTPAPSVVVVYGDDLTNAQRQELSQAFTTGDQATTDRVTRAELGSALQAAGLPVDGSERAMSSAMVTCLAQGDGLRIRTENVTEIPAAAYANALVTVGIADAAVIVAAPPSVPMTGETALVGVLKAYPHCHPGQSSPQDRLRLAYDQLRATASLAQKSGTWDRAAVVMLSGAQAAMTSPSADEASLGTAIDGAAATQGIALDAQQRSEIVDVLKRLSAVDHGAYGAGYAVEQTAANEVRVVPNKRPSQ
jgi:uncharacterized protein YpuA (DUF1002 family)